MTAAKPTSEEAVAKALASETEMTEAEIATATTSPRKAPTPWVRPQSPRRSQRRRPKAPRERRIVIDYDARGFGRGYVGRLRRYIRSERPRSDCREILLSQHRDAQTDSHPPLTTIGVQKLMRRLERACGVHCNPHKLRHTFATRCADNDVPSSSCKKRSATRRSTWCAATVGHVAASVRA
jgi:integrase